MQQQFQGFAEISWRRESIGGCGCNYVKIRVDSGACPESSWSLDGSHRQGSCAENAETGRTTTHFRTRSSSNSHCHVAQLSMMHALTEWLAAGPESSLSSVEAHSVCSFVEVFQLRDLIACTDLRSRIFNLSS
jgi:hypothetical protein